MADDAPSQIEQLLQRYAQQRRAQAGAPFELHPADRRLLQEEAAREYGANKTAESRPALASWLAFLPRFGMAVGLFAVLGLILAAIWHNNQSLAPSQTFAKNNAKKVAPPAEPAITEPSPTLDPAVTLGVAKAATANREELNPAKAVNDDAPAGQQARKRVLDESVQAKDERLRLETSALAAHAMREKAVAVRQDRVEMMAPTAAAPASPAPVQTSERRLQFADQQAAGRGLTEYYFAYAKDTSDKSADAAPAGNGAAMTSRAARPAPGLQMARVMADETKKSAASGVAGANRQRYAILAEPSADAKLKQESDATQVLLAAFEVEIVGDRIRIIDTDGSVYEGALESRPVVAAVLKPTAAPAMKFGQPGMTRGAGGGYAGPRPDAAPAPVSARDREAQATPNQMSFQATGTSRRLGQPVTINGTWGSAANLALLAEKQKETLARLEAASGKAAPSPSAAAASQRISGFLRVGAGPERPLSAVQVEK
jgi:hypothetical protein